VVQDKKAFDFVKISELSPKPRQNGIIEIRGPYYTAVTISYLQDLLDMWGDYIDGFKFAGGSQRLLSIEILKKLSIFVIIIMFMFLLVDLWKE
jgi:phosphosulfolactate synthase (CoM biosynthesis protein A)